MTNTLSKAGLGVGSVTGGVVISHAVVNEWLQTGSLIVGMAVGLASFVSIVLKINHNLKKK